MMIGADYLNGGGGASLEDADFIFTATPTENGTQTINITFATVPKSCVAYITNASGNQLSVTSSDATLTTEDTDNLTYWQGIISGLTTTTMSLTITHNRAGVNQPAQVVLVYV